MKITLVAIYDLYSYGIRGLHSTLFKEGHDVKSVFFKASTYEDSPYTENEINEFVQLILSTEPDLIGIGVRSPLFPLFKKIVFEIKKFSSCKILVGGHHALSSPRSFDSYADFVSMGESEEICKELCYKLSKSCDTSNIKGIYPNKGSLQIQDLNQLEFDYYGDNTFYYKSIKPYNEERMSLYSMRGCFFSCSFCFEGILRNYYKKGYRVRRKNVKRVMEEVSEYKRLFPNLKEIVFSDQIFTWDISWLDTFCKLFSKTGLQFRCFGHVSLTTEEMLKRLKDSGLKTISFGVESGSPRIKKLYNRKEPLNKIIDLSRILAKLDIESRFDFIINSPFENKDDWKQTKTLIDQIEKPITIRNFDMRFFPGTLITDYALKEGLITEKDIEGNTFCKFGNWNFNYKIS